MTNRSAPEEFDVVLRAALTDVAGATQPDPDLADLLLANARSGRPAVTRLAAHRRSSRWMMPLIAVASIVAVAVGAVVVARVITDRGHKTPPAHHQTVPVPTPHLGPPVVPHFDANDLYFSDAQHGWALGDARCPSGKNDCPALLATTDGGASWRALAVPKGLVSTFDTGSCGTNGDVHGPCVDAVLFANASDGYLWSLHDLYATTDGGRHWSRYVDPAHDWDGASKLVVVGRSVVRIAPIHQCSSGCAGSVQFAPIGTTRWQTSTPTSREIGLYSSNLAVAGTQVYLFAGLTEANAGAGIFRSGDGGRTWTRLAGQVCGAARNPQDDAFLGNGSGVADNGALIVDCLGSGLRVAPPGSTAFVGHRLPHGDSIELQGAQGDQRIVVADTSHGYGPGAVSTTFYVTVDGGRTWQRTQTIPVRGDGVCFSNDGHGVAVTQDGTSFYTTDDGGRTWHRAQFGS